MYDVEVANEIKLDMDLVAIRVENKVEGHRVTKYQRHVNISKEANVESEIYAMLLVQTNVNGLILE